MRGKFVVGVLAIVVILMGGCSGKLGTSTQPEGNATQQENTTQPQEVEIIVNGNSTVIAGIDLPINRTEAETIVRESCGVGNQSGYEYALVEEVDGEWRIPVSNSTPPCYATVNETTGETNCNYTEPEEVIVTTVEDRWVLPTGGSGVNWSNIPYAYDRDYQTVAHWNCVGATSYNMRWKVHRNEDAWVYDDKGADHFGSNWVHKIDVKIKATSAQNCYGDIALLSNRVDDAYSLLTGGDTYIGVRVGRMANSYVIQLEEAYLSTLYPAQWNAAQLNTWYYLTITKSGTDLSCTIYSDAARTNPIITLSRTLHADHSFQYIFSADTCKDTLMSAPYCDVYVANLDLGDGGGNEDFLTYTKADPLLPPLHQSHIKFYGGQSPPLTLTLDSSTVCTQLYAVAYCSVASGIAYINLELYYDGAWHSAPGYPVSHDFGEADGGMGVPQGCYFSEKSIEKCRWTIGYPGVETTDAGVRETWFWKTGK